MPGDETTTPRYKVGDVVILKLKITRVDQKGIPYEAHSNFWFWESDIIALATESIPATDEPTTEPLKVAEFARTAMGEVGQIIKTDDGDDTVWILFADAEFHWLGKSKLTRTVKPAAWPF